MTTFKLVHRAAIVALLSIAGVWTPATAGAAPCVRTQALLGTAQLEGQLNLNTATAQQLTLLPGVGPSTASKIVAYRERHPFRRLAHIMRIKGIGKKTFARLRPFLTLEGETTLRVASPQSLPPASSP